MATRKIASVKIRLKGFEEADTSSQLEGYVEPGKYPLVEYRQNFPDANTDYALILAPHLGAGDTWICSRWRDQVYVEFEEIATQTARSTFDDDDAAVDEDILISLLPEFHDFTYDLDEARYPFSVPGIRLPLAPPAQNNCCTFVEGLAVGAWAKAKENFTWSSQQHGQMMIYSADDFFSPVTAIVEAEMGIAVSNPDTPPEPWTVIQGWRNQWRGGHTFFVVDHHQPTDRILTLESNSAYKLNGVGFRGLGNLRDLNGAPPQNWWETEGLWTWERLTATYRFRHMATLRVKNRKWSGLS